MLGYRTFRRGRATHFATCAFTSLRTSVAGAVSRREADRRCCGAGSRARGDHSGRLAPEPPISFGMSLSFVTPSRIGSTDSW